jgi:hypothetical protein
MEELHSTESLDKEILDDAGKKAAKLLKAAEEQIRAAEAEAGRRLTASVAEEQSRLDEKLGAEKAEIETALRLGRRRIYIDKLNGLLEGALASFLASLSRDALLAILQNELSGRMGALGTVDESTVITYRDLSEDELFKLLAAAEPKAPHGDWRRCALCEAGKRFTIPGALPAVVIDTGAVRLSAAVDSAARDALLDKRGEFLTALLGDDALDDGTALDSREAA